MKKLNKQLTALILMMLAFFPRWVEAQVPERISYQAVIRNANGAPVANQTIGMQLSILQGGIVSPAVFVETHRPTTNAYGLVTLEIGSGATIFGDFALIDWSSDSYFLQTETDPDGGINYTISGASEVLSVPYALYAKKADNVFSGDYNDLTNKPDNGDFDGSFSSLTDVPTGLGDGDDNTQLTETEVDAFVANNGYLTAEVDGSVTNEIELPTGGADGQVLKTDGLGNYAWVNQTTDTDTQLGDSDIAAFGYIKSAVDADADATNEIELPAGGSDGQVLKTDGLGNYAWVNQTADTDTQLGDSDIAAFGYIKSADDADADATNEIELPAGGSDGQVLKTDGLGNYAWVNQTTDTNTQLDDSGIAAFGYIKSADDADSDATNEIELPAGGSDGQVLKTDGLGNYAWVNQTTDTDTQLGDSDIAAFGYIKSANDADSDPANEIELPDQTGNSGKYLTTNGTSPSWATVSAGGASQLNQLSDVNTSTATSGNLLIADGTDFESVAVIGDASLASNGSLTIADNAVDGTDIALGSDAAGDVMYYNGTDWVRLPKGTDGQVLTLTGGVPAWASTSVQGNDVVVKTSNYTVSATDGTLVSTNTGTMTFTLPTAAAAGEGKVMYFIAASTTGVINIARSGTDVIIDDSGSSKTTVSGVIQSIIVSDGVSTWYSIFDK